MSRRHSFNLLFLATICSTGILVADQAVPIPAPLRAGAGLALVLVLPGCAIVQMLFPDGRLDAGTFWAFSCAASLVVAALAGLALDLTPAGLVARSWAVLLAGVTLSASVLALLRRRRVPARAAPPQAPALETRSGFNTRAVLMSTAVLLVCLAVWSGFKSEAEQDRPGFTQLWLVPAGEDRTRARVGLANYEGRAMRYRLRLLASGEPVTEWGPIDVGEGDRWEIAGLPVDPGLETSVDLYRLDEPGRVYRTVRLKPRE